MKEEGHKDIRYIAGNQHELSEIPPKGIVLRILTSGWTRDSQAISVMQPCLVPHCTVPLLCCLCVMIIRLEILEEAGEAREKRGRMCDQGNAVGTSPATNEQKRFQ